jgi:hypothetical protein
MNTNDVIKECRQLAKTQNLTFGRSKTIDKINGKAAYSISSGVTVEILDCNNLVCIWHTLLSCNLVNK